MLAIFNVNGSEYLIIAVVALIVLGPEQLPATLRRVGGYLRQFRDVSENMKAEFISGMNELDPTTWQGKGTDDDPIVPRGFAKDVSPGGPFDARPGRSVSSDVALPADSEAEVAATSEVTSGDAAGADEAESDTEAAAGEAANDRAAEIAEIAPTDPWGRPIPRPAVTPDTVSDTDTGSEADL